MIKLHQRSYQKELMDEDNIPFEAIAQTLKELNIVNSQLGGHAITLLHCEVVPEILDFGDRLFLDYLARLSPCLLIIFNRLE